MRRPRGALLGLLALVTAVNVLALPREEYIGDPVAIRIETVHLLRTGSLGVVRARSAKNFCARCSHASATCSAW